MTPTKYQQNNVGVKLGLYTLVVECLGLPSKLTSIGPARNSAHQTLPARDQLTPGSLSSELKRTQSGEWCFISYEDIGIYAGGGGEWGAAMK